jgi:hypothetical protein
MKPVWALGFVVWAGAVVTGMNVLWRYRSTASASATTSDRWPDGSRLARDKARPTLVMFIHPHCPCSRATISELAELMERDRDRASVRVLFVKPDGTEEGWERTDSWNSANRIPGVVVETDRGGTEAVRFGAHTSGQALLFDAHGGLLFQGGITGGRGHVGNNLGRARVEALLEGRTPDRSTSPVFGCALLSGEDSKEARR